MNIKGNLESAFSDQKSRIFIFLMISIIVIVLFVAYFSQGPTVQEEKASQGVSSSASVQNPGNVIVSTPGVTETSPEFKRLQEQKYQQQSDAALKNQGTPVASLPSLSTGLTLGNGDGISAIPGVSQTDPRQSQLDEQRRIQQDLQRQRVELLDQQKKEQEAKAQQASMARQLQVLTRNWQVIPQAYVVGQPLDNSTNASNRSRGDTIDNNNSDPNKQSSINYKAGDILFAVILTSINSDEPGPILARVVSGPLSGSKVIGSINPATIPTSGKNVRVSRALMLQFNLMNIPGKKSSVPFSGVAIDPQTARTGLASSVNNHYMLRYGSFFAASFLSGLGQALTLQAQTKVVTGNGTADLGVNNKDFSPTEEGIIALGKTAEQFVQSLDFLDTPPTIKVNAGTAVGILLQNDLVISGDNTDDLIRSSIIGTPVLGTGSSNAGQPVVTGVPGGTNVVVGTGQ